MRKVTPDDVALVKRLGERGRSEREIADISDLSRATVSRILDGRYNDKGTYIGGEPKTNKPVAQPDDQWEWLKDALTKILYETCLTNDRLKNLLEKWQ